MPNYKNSECLDLFLDAQRGSKKSQKLLLNHIDKICNPLAYSFYGNLREYGVSLEDLFSLKLDALYLMMKKVLDSSQVYNFDNYFKFYYIKTVQSYLRKIIKKSSIFHYSTINIDDDNECDRNEYLVLSQPNAPDELKNTIFNDEIYQNAVIDNRADLSKIESEIVKLFINNYTLDEISKLIKKSYQSVYKYLKRALYKVEQFIKDNYHEIYKEYSSNN